MVAYHEAGHAIVAANLEHADPVHKVTIVPRGRAGGVTYTLPENDRDEVSRDWCLDTVTMAMGGRVAEQMILGRIGSGAQSDILQATKTVRRMVTRWGMSEALGPVAYGETEEQIFLGKEWGHKRDFSEATAQKIDDEVKRIISECFDRAKKILTERTDQLHLLAKTLLERETVDGDELRKLLSGEELPPVRSIAPQPPAGERPATGATAEAGTGTAGAPAAPERPNTAAANQSNPSEHKAPKPAAG
jgi:cell division protease FtsH